MGTISKRNAEIIQMFNSKISEAGLEGKLAVEAVANTFTYRPRYFSYADGIPRFKVHLWDINKLPDEMLECEVSNRIEQARRYYKL